MLNRRGFIQVTGITTGAVLVGTQLTGCSGAGDSTGIQVIGWEQPQTQTDIRLTLLAYAMLAPNPHNIQPWRVKLVDDNGLLLYVDPERLLPETDPYHRQIHIGQGTFLEMLRIAASHFGLQANLDYFPEGEYNNLELQNKAIAKVTLQPSDIKEDPLFEYIFQRHSNKRAYDNTAISENEAEAIRLAMRNSHSELHIYSGQEHRANLQNTLVEAMAIESSDTKRDLETIAMFRFNDDEVQQLRDGFGVAQSGVTGIMKFMAETFFLSREKAEKNPKTFGQQAIDSVKAVADTTHSFAWLNTSTNSRLDQVKAGHDYCRLNLITTQLGLAQHPMSQVLEEYAAMLLLQQQFKNTLNIASETTVQMFCRLGYAKDCDHTPRRAVEAIIV